MQIPQTITVDGKQYELSQFSDNVARLVEIFTKWQSQLLEQKLEVTKTEAAIRSLDAELLKLVTEEIKQKEETPAEESKTKPKKKNKTAD